jgi:hypothetical protein
MRIILNNGNGLILLNLFACKTADNVSGGVRGRRPRTFGEPTLLVSNIFQ